MNATPVLTCEHLTLADCNVLARTIGQADCRTVEEFAERNPDLDQIWHSLRHTTHVPVMIACAALRGKATKLPPDPRLNPKPYPKAPHAAPRSTTQGSPATPARRTTPGKPAWTVLTATLVAVVPNPKKPGSATYERFKNYVIGRTVAEILTLGSTRGDLNWDGQRGFVTFKHPEE